MNEKPVAIDVNSVTKTYYTAKNGKYLNNPLKKTKHKVIDNVSFKIAKGEVVGIIGRNGSGKSTLLSMIAGITEPDKGTIIINGKTAAILELGMGFHSDLSGRENIKIKGGLYGIPKKEILEKMEKIIEYSGLSEYIDEPVRTYSSGMSARLAFSIMINVEADVMVIDEVLSVGDISFVSKAKDYFRKIAHSGKTIVLVSHSLADISSICSRVIWIEKGKILADGSPNVVIPRYKYAVAEDPEIVSELASFGNAEAQYKLAILYKHGDVFEKSDTLYNKWLKMSSDQGYAPAQVEYADKLLCEGDENREEALALFQSAANNGNQEAMLKIASFLGEDASLAITDYVGTLFSSHNPERDYLIGMYLLKTTVSPAEKERAFGLISSAADFEYPPALYQLAIMYKEAIGTKKDIQKSIENLEKAIHIGHLPSLLLLKKIYFEGIIVERDYAKAFNLCKISAEIGHRASQYELAVHYRDGLGVKQNPHESSRWFTRFVNNNPEIPRCLTLNDIKTWLNDDALFDLALY